MDNSKIKIDQGAVLNNQQLCDLFGCSPQGGMRRSKATNTLILISNHVESIYDDRWIDDIFHYTGMGLTGDQRITFSQNKTLAESLTNGIDVHLFEVFKEKEYTYLGKVFLVEDPYTETQLDQIGNLRSVWMFPIKLKETGTFHIPLQTVEETIEHKIRKAKKLSENELRQRVQSAPPKPGNRPVISNQYQRNPWVSEFVKRIAKGVCQLCKSNAPFMKSKGEPFLEVHHIIWLARGGDDSILNAVALCPNCHRKMHILDREIDRALLLEEVIKINRINITDNTSTI